MREVGELLRKRREELGLELEQAQASTKIRLRYLAALEEGDDSVFPGEVYLKGFLRTYADFLGLDGRALVSQYGAARAEAPASGRRSPRRAPPRPVRLGRPSRIWSFLFVLILLGVLAWLVAGRSLFLPSEDVVVDEPEPVVDQTPAAPPVAPPAPVPAPEPSVSVVQVTDEPTRAEFEVVASELKVEILVREACWVRVVIDGSLVTEETLAAGATREWTAVESVFVRFGNPDGVEMVIAGQQQGRAGSHRTPRDVTIVLKPEE